MIHRRDFLKGLLITAAPAIVDSKQLFRGAVDVFMPPEPDWNLSDNLVLTPKSEIARKTHIDSDCFIGMDLANHGYHTAVIAYSVHDNDSDWLIHTKEVTIAEVRAMFPDHKIGRYSSFRMAITDGLDDPEPERVKQAKAKGVAVNNLRNKLGMRT